MDKKTYLVAVDRCFLDHPSGGTRVAWDWAQIVKQAGGQVTLVAMAMGDDAPTYELSEEEDIQILRVRKPLLSRWDPRSITATVEAVANAVAATLPTKGWDIVHCHSPQAGLGVLKALQPGATVIKTMHSPMTLEFQANSVDRYWLRRIKELLGLRYLHQLESQELRQSDVVHVLSRFTKSKISELHDSAPPVKIIPHWRRPELQRTMSKAEARLQLGWDPDETILFTLRHHGARNGIDTAIKAVAPLAKEGKCRFFIGGTGGLFHYHADLIREHRVEDRIHLMGRISEEEMTLAYQAADVFLLPTRALECFGLIIQEAYAFGCPVIGTTAGAIPELIKPISPQALVPPDDDAALRSKIESYLNGVLQLPSSEELVAYVDGQYGPDIIVPRILEWLTSLLRVPQTLPHHDISTEHVSTSSAANAL